MKVVIFNAVRQLVNISFDMNFIYAAYNHLPSSIHQTYKIAMQNSKCGEGKGEGVSVILLHFSSVTGRSKIK